MRGMLTQNEIAERFGLSLSMIRKCAMRRNFPPVEHVGGKTGRLNYYNAGAVRFWWENRTDGRKRRRKR